MRKIFLLTAFALLFTGSVGVVEACTCGGTPSVCMSYLAADAVFTGTVRRVELPRPRKDADGEEYVAGQVAYIQVEKAFKGMEESEVIFRTEGSSCDPVYEEGERRLFYAYYDKKGGRWVTHACDRNGLVERAADDLLYLQGLPASARQTRIGGQLAQYEEDPAGGSKRLKNIAGAKVKITGERQTYEVYTDKNGAYEIYGLPPGKYSVEPEPLAGLKIRSPMLDGERDSSGGFLKLVLKERGCAGASFLYSAATSISGTLFGADGRALPNVCLALTPKEKPAQSDNWKADCTDEQGRYKIDEIPPGEYLIAVNDGNTISSEAPFPMAYYPGVFEREKAAVIIVTAGDLLEGYDIHIPSQEATRVLRGVLLYSDGQPVADESVEFKADSVKKGYDGEARTRTDAQGRFSLTVLQGLKGSLYGLIVTYEGEHVNCPMLDKIIRAKGRSMDVTTKPLQIEINSDMQDLKLVFPFPRCEKAK